MLPYQSSVCASVPNHQFGIIIVMLSQYILLNILTAFNIEHWLL